jgi:hypothetical protein
MPLPASRATVRRSLATLAALAAVATLATACGEDDEAPRADDGPTSPAAPVALTAEQVEEATLTLQNLGAGWEQQPADPDDEEDSPGCLADIDAVTADLEESAKHETQFVHGEAGLPNVQAGVAAYPEEDAIAEGFDGVESAIEACDSVAWTEDDFTYSITLEPDTDLPFEGIDDQNGFTATGTVVFPDGRQSPIHLHVTYLRLGPNVASVATTAAVDESAVHAEYAHIAARRLIAVAAGEVPEETVASTP